MMNREKRNLNLAHKRTLEECVRLNIHIEPYKKGQYPIYKGKAIKIFKDYYEYIIETHN